MDRHEFGTFIAAAFFGESLPRPRHHSAMTRRTAALRRMVVASLVQKVREKRGPFFAGSKNGQHSLLRELKTSTAVENFIKPRSAAMSLSRIQLGAAEPVPATGRR